MWNVFQKLFSYLWCEILGCINCRLMVMEALKIMILVSVVIPNYNGEAYLKTCLEALSKQEGVDYEVIVVDNGSSDSDYSWIKSYHQTVLKRLDHNYGFCKAVNIGIQMAQGEYVLLLNNDTIVEKDFIKKLVEAIQNRPKVFSVSSQMIKYQDKDRVDDAGDEYTIMGWAYKSGDGDLIEQHNKAKYVFSACAGAAIYRKKIFQEIGYLDENFFAYVEDVDLGYRARIFGYENLYCPEAKVYHIGSATSGSKYNEFKVKLAAKNNLLVQYKNQPLLQLVINLLPILLGWVIKYIWFKNKGYGKVFIEGLKEGFKELKYIKKVPVQWSHMNRYIKIEILMIKNAFAYIFSKLDGQNR